MKLIRFSVIAAFAVVASLLFGGCSDDEGIDNRERDYGYVQFRLYKDASYEAPQRTTAQTGTRAIKPELDYLSEASKVRITLTYQDMTITQTLTLSAADKEWAEYGLRSEKLKLLTGEYEIVTFALYDANDELIYNGAPLTSRLIVVAGGLTPHDLTVNTVPRGKVKFTLVKDKADVANRPDTRAVERQYVFDEIATINITVQNKTTNEQTRFERLPMTFSIHFDDDEDTFGYQTSSSKCDSLLSLPAGDYQIITYQTYDKDKNLLETNYRPKSSDFTVEDNRTTEVRASITLYESDAYLQDYYALYEIWKSLDGENWYYSGENFPEGSNWDFNKDPDLWGSQPGVELHSNGRVAKVSISDFGFRGDMSPEIGKLTQLVELYLGTHNDGNLLEYDPSLSPDKTITERTRNRMEYNKKFLSLIHPATQMSEPCAFALRQHGIHIPATSLYDEGFTEKQIIEAGTGRQKVVRPYDTVHGKLCNGLRSLPMEIGRLQNLEFLYIANSEIETLPDSLALLSALTDVEVYNCPKMTEFPMALTKLPKLISLNISNNAQWDAAQIYKGLDGLASGPGKEEIQILYCRDNLLEELPESFRNMKKLGLLDLTGNRISVLHPMGEVAPVQLFLDKNQIESFPMENGAFCVMDDLESFSASYNKLTEFPNIFTAKTKYMIGSVDFSNNQITGFPADFKGIRVETLTLACNPITKFPKCIGDTGSLVNYIILRGCLVDEIPKDSFKGKYSSSMVSFDLTYNKLTKLPDDFTAEDLPYLYGLDISYNSFSSFPKQPLNCSGLTVLAVRGQRNDQGERCLREWPTNIGQHASLRGLYMGSNDLRKIDDNISYLIFHLEISDNPNITFDASNVCYYWQNGVYNLIYDKSQNIINCDAMLE